MFYSFPRLSFKRSKSAVPCEMDSRDGFLLELENEGATDYADYTEGICWDPSV